MKLLIQLIKFVFLVCLVTQMSSCETDIEKINALTNELDLPSHSGKDVEIFYSDSGYLKLKIKTPELNNFDAAEKPYIEFPKGGIIYFYTDSQKIESYIKAKYAIYYEEEELWETRNDVVAVNKLKGETLNTEQLFWDDKKDIIYSNTYSKIVNSSGTFYGDNGFEAKEDMSEWKLKRSRGTVNLKDEKTE
jgi:LPS export ABC transporter protein LptC